MAHDCCRLLASSVLTICTPTAAMAAAGPANCCRREDGEKAGSIASTDQFCSQGNKERERVFEVVVAGQVWDLGGQSSIRPYWRGA